VPASTSPTSSCLACTAGWRSAGSSRSTASSTSCRSSPASPTSASGRAPPVGARIGATGWLAGEARLAGGTLLDRAGLWGSGALGATARKVVDPTLAFQGTLGGNYLRVDFDGDGGALWLAEVESRGDIQLRAPNGIAGVWVGVGFAFPIAHDGGYPAMGRFAPQTRGDLHVGGVYAVVPSWDVYVEYSILDRGDLVDPQTTVPVLAGGFDQRQLMLGVTRRFDVDEDDEAARLAW